jgi:hypothetical protein
LIDAAIKIYHGDMRMRDGETEEEAEKRAREIWELGGSVK